MDHVSWSRGLGHVAYVVTRGSLNVVDTSFAHIHLTPTVHVFGLLMAQARCSSQWRGKIGEEQARPQDIKSEGALWEKERA